MTRLFGIYTAAEWSRKHCMNGLHIGRGMKMNPGMFCIHTFGEYVFVGEYAQIIQIMHGWFVILYL